MSDLLYVIKEFLGSSAGILFTVCGIAAVFGAIATVASQNPLRAAMALLLHIVSLAGMYLTLHAHLLAALQLIVYAGAIVVLFVFVIMLIGPTSDVQATWRGFLVRLVSALLMVLVGGAIVFQIGEVTADDPPPIAECASTAGSECGQFGGVGALGRAIYGGATKPVDDPDAPSTFEDVGAAVPFEIVSVLLLVAVIGAIAVARGRSAEESELAKARKIEAARLARQKELAAGTSAAGAE